MNIQNIFHKPCSKTIDFNGVAHVYMCYSSSVQTCIHNYYLYSILVKFMWPHLSCTYHAYNEWIQIPLTNCHFQSRV